MSKCNWENVECDGCGYCQEKYFESQQKAGKCRYCEMCDPQGCGGY